MKRNCQIKYFFRITLVMFGLCMSSCKKFVTVSPPAGTTSIEIAFSNDSLANETVTGIYIQAMNTNLTLLNGLDAYLGLSADELAITTGNPNELQFFSNTLVSSNPIVNNNIWKSGYTNLYHINACIEQLAKSSNISSPLKSRLSSESKFMRALTYFYLVNLFGEVPLVTGTSMNINDTIHRSSVVDVYSKILADLQDAYQNLPDIATYTRPTKLAAAALLARVYCYQHDWMHAESFSSMVINDGKYLLEPGLDTVFLSGSRETIFQLAPVLSNNSTSEGLSFIPVGNATPKFFATANLLAAFDPTDKRKTHWLKIKSVGAQTYYYPFKYKISRGATASEYNVVLRLAEQYLIHAEAKTYEGDFASATADLNIIRNRAGLSPLTVPADQTACLQTIVQERRIELFAEWGHRWFDLVRTGQADIILPLIKGAWAHTSQLFPIPISEIQFDHNLTQNQGY